MIRNSHLICLFDWSKSICLIWHSHLIWIFNRSKSICLIRNSHLICPNEVLEFLLNLFKYNDNSKNSFSDNYYRAALVTALGKYSIWDVYFLKYFWLPFDPPPPNYQKSYTPVFNLVLVRLYQWRGLFGLFCKEIFIDFGQSLDFLIGKATSSSFPPETSMQSLLTHWVKLFKWYF